MPWRRPDQEYACPFRHCVSKDYHVVLGQPEGRLKPPSSVVESRKASGKHSVRFNYLQLAFRNVVGPEESRTEGTNLIPADKLVNVPDVVRNRHCGHGWRPLV